MTLNEIISIIHGECFNSCTDARSTFEYFEAWNRYKRGPEINLKALKPLLEVINFAALRENSGERMTTTLTTFK